MRNCFEQQDKFPKTEGAVACDTLAQTAEVLSVTTSLGKAQANERQGTILCCWTGERDYSNLLCSHELHFFITGEAICNVQQSI